MNFDLGDKEKQIRERLHHLLEADLPGILENLASNDSHKSRKAMLSAFEKIASSGYADLVFSKEGTAVASMAVREELAFICPALYLSLESGNGLLINLLNSYGTEQQKQEILPALKSCKGIGSVAVVEEHGNIEDNPFESSLTDEGNHFTLSGKKNMVINAAIADWLAVVAMMNSQPALGIVSPDTKGLTIGSRILTLGLEPSLFYEVNAHGVELLSNNIMGPFEGEAFISQLRMWEDEILVGASLGIMRRAYEAARTHAKTHNCGGKPIVAYQEVGFKLAEMLTLVHTAQLLAYRAAWMLDTRDKERGVLLHCAKVFCAEAAESVASNAVQILGGNGYIRGNKVEQAYRDAKFIQIAGTSTERARVKIGDSLLEMW